MEYKYKGFDVSINKGDYGYTFEIYYDREIYTDQHGCFLVAKSMTEAKKKINLYIKKKLVKRLH